MEWEFRLLEMIDIELFFATCREAMGMLELARLAIQHCGFAGWACRECDEMHHLSYATVLKIVMCELCELK